MRLIDFKIYFVGSVLFAIFLITPSAVYSESDRLPGITYSLDRVGDVMRNERGRPEIRSDSVSGGPAIHSVSFDFSAGGEQVSAVQFTIGADGDLGSVSDVRSCSASLPETHIGGCKIKGEKVLFYAFSPVNAPLPAGNILKLNLTRPVAPSGFTVKGIVMADVNGKELKNFQRPE